MINEVMRLAAAARKFEALAVAEERSFLESRAPR